jgi:RNA polymerase sigma-70 factor (ECF subfamily)
MPPVFDRKSARQAAAQKEFDRVRRPRYGGCILPGGTPRVRAMTAADDSFSAFMGRLRSGDEAAAVQLYHQFAQRLIGLAHTRLNHHLRRKLDAEDIVQSALRSFFVRNARGQLVLKDWDNLWNMLVLITVRKCADRAAQFDALCRDVRREAPGDAAPGDSGDAWQTPSTEPRPEEALLLVETLEQLLADLDPLGRAIVELSLDGAEVRQISARLGCTERMVYRKLEIARQRLERMRDSHLQQS